MANFSVAALATHIGCIIQPNLQADRGLTGKMFGKTCQQQQKALSDIILFLDNSIII